MQAKTLTRHREPIFEEMEQCLSIWIRDETAKSMLLNMATISRKAIKLFEKLQEEGWQVKEGTQFTASKGRFDSFKNRAGLHNVKTTGEAASADKEAAESFLATLKKRIEDGRYSPHQVINYDETGLYWKRMSGRTFIFKDRLTLSLGGNTALAEEEEEEDKESRCLTLAKLCEALNGVDTLMGILQDADPNTARSDNAVQAMNDALKIYREIYQHKKQLHTGFFYYKNLFIITTYLLRHTLIATYQ